MMREWLGMSVGLLIALVVFGAPACAQVNFDRPGETMQAFPCGPVILPNAPLAASAMRAAARGRFPIR